MFTKHKFIIAITKQSVQICIVALEKTPRKVQTKTYPLAGRTLADIFTTIAPLVKTSALILISEDLSYTLTLTIPANTDKLQERKIVEQKIQPEIPEVLENNEWDFKEIKTTKNGKEILVFAPVKKFFTELSAAALKAKVKIDAIEPVSIAITRHEDPIIGLALKQDLKGKDEDVLVLTPAPPTPAHTSPTTPATNATQTPQEQTEEPTQSSFYANHKNAILVLVLLIILGSMGGIWYMFFHSDTQQDAEPEQVAQEVSETEPSSTPEPTEEAPSPTPGPPDYSILSVQVLNGTGEEGASGEVRALIEDLGFALIEVDNAETFTYFDTEIAVKESVPQEVIDTITELLSDYSVVQIDLLTNNFEYDVLITVGEKI